MFVFKLICHAFFRYFILIIFADENKQAKAEIQESMIYYKNLCHFDTQYIRLNVKTFMQREVISLFFQVLVVMFHFPFNMDFTTFVITGHIP